jgi:hypothetical protein
MGKTISVQDGNDGAAIIPGPQMPNRWLSSSGISHATVGGTGT